MWGTFLISEWEDMRSPGAVSEVQLASLPVWLQAENSSLLLLVMEGVLDPYQWTEWMHCTFDKPNNWGISEAPLFASAISMNASIAHFVCRKFSSLFGFCFVTFCLFVFALCCSKNSLKVHVLSQFLYMMVELVFSAVSAKDF